MYPKEFASHDNYLDKHRYGSYAVTNRAMAGNSSFSESFISEMLNGVNDYNNEPSFSVKPEWLKTPTVI